MLYELLKFDTIFYVLSSILGLFFVGAIITRRSSYSMAYMAISVTTVSAMFVWVLSYVVAMFVMVVYFVMGACFLFVMLKIENNKNTRKRHYFSESWGLIFALTLIFAFETMLTLARCTHCVVVSEKISNPLFATAGFIYALASGPYFSELIVVLALVTIAVAGVTTIITRYVGFSGLKTIIDYEVSHRNHHEHKAFSGHRHTNTRHVVNEGSLDR